MCKRGLFLIMSAIQEKKVQLCTPLLIQSMKYLLDKRNKPKYRGSSSHRSSTDPLILGLRIGPRGSRHHCFQRVECERKPRGWAGRGQWGQDPGRGCWGRVEPGYWAELPGGPRYLPSLWPEENHSVRWREDVWWVPWEPARPNR